jgi:hypothetical protein
MCFQTEPNISVQLHCSSFITAVAPIVVHCLLSQEEEKIYSLLEIHQRSVVDASADNTERNTNLLHMLTLLRMATCHWANVLQCNYGFD